MSYDERLELHQVALHLGRCNNEPHDSVRTTVRSAPARTATNIYTSHMYLLICVRSYTKLPRMAKA